MDRVIANMECPRDGQSVRFADCTRAFAPTVVHGNHWVGFLMEKEDNTIIAMDSLNGTSTANEQGLALELFLSRIDDKPWKFTGQDFAVLH